LNEEKKKSQKRQISKLKKIQKFEDFLKKSPFLFHRDVKCTTSLFIFNLFFKFLNKFRFGIHINVLGRLFDIVDHRHDVVILWHILVVRWNYAKSKEHEHSHERRLVWSISLEANIDFLAV